jgi:hypothetical protein
LRSVGRLQRSSGRGPQERTLIAHAEDFVDLDIGERTERLEQRLRPVEVAIVDVPSATDHPTDFETWNELGRLIWCKDPRPNTKLVLKADVSCMRDSAFCECARKR